MIKNDNDYLQFFYDTVLTGIICGLEHPIEWIVNADRIPGGTLEGDYYKWIEKHTSRFLYEMYEIYHYEPPKCAKDVLDWCDDHYKHNTMCQKYFNHLESKIQEYIDKRNLVK